MLADQYGIRTMLTVVGQPIKFEIVFEARIGLALPRSLGVIFGVSSLTEVDLATNYWPI